MTRWPHTYTRCRVSCAIDKRNESSTKDAGFIQVQRRRRSKHLTEMNATSNQWTASLFSTPTIQVLRTRRSIESTFSSRSRFTRCKRVVREWLQSPRARRLVFEPRITWDSLRIHLSVVLCRGPSRSHLSSTTRRFSQHGIPSDARVRPSTCGSPSGPAISQSGTSSRARAAAAAAVYKHLLGPWRPVLRRRLSKLIRPRRRHRGDPLPPEQLPDAIGPSSPFILPSKERLKLGYLNASVWLRRRAPGTQRESACTGRRRTRPRKCKLMQRAESGLD